jgi:hypothetical protein
MKHHAASSLRSKTHISQTKWLGRTAMEQNVLLRLNKPAAISDDSQLFAIATASGSVNYLLLQ